MSRKHGKTRIRIELRQLELAKGHDGFLRGSPEPVLLVGAYLLEEDRVRVLDRSICRVATPNRFPCSVAPKEPELIARWIDYKRPARVALLLLALEEDGGGDVERIYAALERHADIAVWPWDEPVPAPRALHELDLGQLRVNVMVEGIDLNQSCASDEWVDAAAIVLQSRSPQVLTRRVHLVSPDRRNDWTAELGLYV